MSRINFIENKIVSLEEAKLRIATWKMKTDNVVFTNGCFDILHLGHITYLAKTADLGNRLIVAVNSDESVKRQGKGDDRPINPEQARATIIAALGFVDMVILFDENTPLDLIKDLNPSVLVKGADYDPLETDKSSKKYIVGSDIVRANGGEVKVIDLVDGFSTTGIVNKLKA
jgi:D-glycero-beta-D-manno-heptose 1-phosphate adenylyltransferase